MAFASAYVAHFLLSGGFSKAPFVLLDMMSSTLGIPHSLLQESCKDDLRNEEMSQSLFEELNIK